MNNSSQNQKFGRSWCFRKVLEDEVDTANHLELDFSLESQ